MSKIIDAPKGAKTAAGKAIDSEELRAQQVAKLKSFVEQFELAENLAVGSWIGVPDEYKDWHFVRFNKAVPHHRETAYMMMRQGYTDCATKEALKGVRCFGFEADGENRLYLCAHPEVYHTKRELADRAKRGISGLLEESAFGGHLDAVRNMPGVESVEVVDKGLLPSPRG